MKENNSNITLPCPDCNGQLILKNSKQYGLFYGCERFPKCRGTHRAHPNGEPLGIPGDKATRWWRIQAHKALEKLFTGQHPLMTKDEAYLYMQELMDLNEQDGHISRFNIEQCNRLIELLQ